MGYGDTLLSLPTGTEAQRKKETFPEESEDQGARDTGLPAQTRAVSERLIRQDPGGRSSYSQGYGLDLSPECQLGALGPRLSVCTLPMLFHLYHLVNCLHREAVATLPLCGKMRAQDKVRNWHDQGATGSQEHGEAIAGGCVFPGSVWNPERQLGPSNGL